MVRTQRPLPNTTNFPLIEGIASFGPISVPTFAQGVPRVRAEPSIALDNIDVSSKHSRAISRWLPSMKSSGIVASPRRVFRILQYHAHTIVKKNIVSVQLFTFHVDLM
jgi:hypothetical protein